jgi:hypothetical protein
MSSSKGILTFFIKHKGKGKGKGKVRPRTGNEGPGGKKRYRTTLTLTTAPARAGGQRHALVALPPRNMKKKIYQYIKTLYTKKICFPGLHPARCWLTT